MNKTPSRKRASENLKSTIASFKAEEIVPTKQVINYCKMRDDGKTSCHTDVERLKKKYRNMVKK